MSVKNKFVWLNRRAFLGGAGTLVAMPFLESLAPRKALAAGAAPKRFLAYYFACGIPNIADWKPTATGMAWEPSMLLQDLMPIKNKVTVLSNLRNAGQGPDHTYGTGAFLTGRNGGEGSRIAQSIDQVIADHIQAGPNKTQIHSLQLGVNDSLCEPVRVAGACVFLNNISYGAMGNALTKEMRLQAAFDRLFNGTALPTPGMVVDDSVAKRRQALRKSVLDAVTQDAASVSKALSKRDQSRFDEYLTSIRRIEQQVAGGGASGAGPACTGKPTAVPAGGTHEAEVDAWTEIMALAFECDLTRVISFMMTAGATGKSNLAQGNYHLGITHHGVADWEPKFRNAVTWKVLKFAKLLQRLDSKKDVDGVSTILDNTAVFFSSEISDGNRHNHTDMPVLLGGSLGGGIRPGNHIAYTEETWFADLFMFIAKQMGVTGMTAFGTNGADRIKEI